MGKDSEEQNDDDAERSGIDSVIEQLQQRHLGRDRGLFTTTDREFLLGIKQYDHEQSKINKRRDIRSRIGDGLIDLQLLDRISNSDRDKIFSQLEHGEIHESIARLVAFVYTGLDGNTSAIEQMVESGLFKAERGGITGYSGGARDVDVTINLTLEYDVEDIYQRFERGYSDYLTPAEIGVLVREGRLKPEDYEELSWDENERPRNTPAADREQWYWGDETE
jgi:hypothetical protein